MTRFNKCTPVAVNGEKACADIAENRRVGLKCCCVYETPGVTRLYKAHECLEQIVFDRETFFEVPLTLILSLVSVLFCEAKNIELRR